MDDGIVFVTDGRAEPDAMVAVAGGEATDLTSLADLADRVPDRLLVLADDADATDERHWALLGMGATDVLEAGAASAASICARLKRWQHIDELVYEARADLVGRSPALVRTLRTTIEGTRFTHGPILLTGESGTGKELLARLVHDVGRRFGNITGNLELVDCSTIVPELAGSEFFGHERGAYTGAAGARDGAFARADGGTLFLDEVGELPLLLQAELLRVVQEGTYKRVGGDTWRRTRFRLVCATNRDLSEEVESGRFRADLYYRIAAWPCTVPSLEARREDVLALADHFLREAGITDALSQPVCRYLSVRRYPGNVRELRQLTNRIAARHAGAGPVTLGAIPASDRPVPSRGEGWPDTALVESLEIALSSGIPLESIKRTVAEATVDLALQRSGGRTSDAAALLGVSPRALQQRRAKRESG
jgi:transcriptional regulator with GAF, ATPase, and Fis domain